jgi:hypothetical protein
MEKIVETWLGLGAKDGHLTPVANPENALYSQDSKFYGEFRNPLPKGAAKKLIGRPGWFRFSSDYVLKVTHAGQTFERRGVTLHEMVALE